jgi:hypothetical protein
VEVEQGDVIKFFVEEGMKRMEIVDRLNHHYRDALQRTQVYCWIKEVQSEGKDSSNIPSRGRASDEGLDDCIRKGLKEDPHLSTRKIARASNIGSTTVRNHLTKSLGMKCYHMRWVPHTLTAAQNVKHS